jgi:hypothetical protein
MAKCDVSDYLRKLGENGQEEAECGERELKDGNRIET